MASPADDAKTNEDTQCPIEAYNWNPEAPVYSPSVPQAPVYQHPAETPWSIIDEEFSLQTLDSQGPSVDQGQAALNTTKQRSTMLGYQLMQLSQFCSHPSYMPAVPCSPCPYPEFYDGAQDVVHMYDMPELIPPEPPLPPAPPSIVHSHSALSDYQFPVNAPSDYSVPYSYSPPPSQSQQSRRGRQKKPAKPAPHKASIVRHVTLADRSVQEPGKVLEKVWLMKNTGKTTWRDVGLVCIKDSPTEPMDISPGEVLKIVRPGEEIEVRAVIQVPRTEGRHCCYYRLSTPTRRFGPRVWADILVDGSAPRAKPINMTAGVLKDLTNFPLLGSFPSTTEPVLQTAKG